MLRATLLKLSESKRLAHWVTSNSPTRRMSHRFVAGETLDEALAAARACNATGMLASLDYLGENVSTVADAQRARDTYLEIFERIAEKKLNANVSCKLTQLGLDLSVEFCEGLVASVVERAASYDNFLRVDMEGSPYTQRTIELVKRVRSRNPAVGAVIQAYLYRSERDVQDLLGLGCRIRLCKGAYKEPPEVAFVKKKEVDANFVKLMQMLLVSGFYHGIATHDPKMITATIRFAAERKISKDDFEFQMLYGIRTDLQQRLVRDGYRLRIYIPFGRDWFPYFMRRLAERPANVAFFLRNLLRS
ncbi:MAG: proline dehydrogenase [Acidobacteria bacterium 13_1_40CM_2_60_7]|nr:MAG: proline dehydrogenase [Acidobacteria bacterium 13_1_40CM_4_61_5]OLD60842.1 MAG: proline dehydrogenase [Acidobacteria bacterium 13_1_40CM_2_60_7]PYU05969.1 MAG: proline dehydrogenase [Acidobacteriota bacterium]